MKLNLDCIRDLLMAFEEITDGHTNFFFRESDVTYKDWSLPVDKYSFDEIEYHVKQCAMSGLLVGTQFPADGGFILIDLSPKGHEFIANIRADTNWNKVKKALSKAGSFSLSMAQSVAAGVAEGALKSFLGLP